MTRYGINNLAVACPGRDQHFIRLQTHLTAVTSVYNAAVLATLRLHLGTWQCCVCLYADRDVCLGCVAGHAGFAVVLCCHGTRQANISYALQKEELIPFYMKRALEAYPSCTHISGLSAGVDAAMRELPSGSPVVLLTLHSLADHASALLSASGRMKHNPEAGLDLIRLLAQMLLVVEFQFLPDALSIVDAVVLGCPSTDVQLSACNCIHEVLMTSDDYTRKVRCAQWYQHLAAACAAVKPVSALAADDFQTLSLTKDTNLEP